MDRSTPQSDRRRLPVVKSSSGGHPDLTALRRRAPTAFHVLAKPTGAICNLDCKYCFFLSKEALYPGSEFRMADDVLEAYIKQLIESQRGPEVTVAWQGGEPTLMGLDFFRRAVELVDRHRRPGTRITHTMQTNGVLLDETWCAFLREHRVLVGLSMDGPRRLHDAYRVDRGGKPTFDKVLRAARRLEQHGVELNILCTVHAANAGHPLEVYRFFRDEVGARFLQLIPIVERSSGEPSRDRGDRPLYQQRGHAVTDRSVDPEAWGRFLIAVFDEWLRKDVGTMFVQMFESALASWMGLPASLCVFAETCGDALALEHNGDLYSCDHYVEPDYKLGNIKERHMLELVASEKQRAFGRAKRDELPAYCRECEVRFACHGECPRNRFIETPDGEPGLNYLCAGYKAFFKHVDRPMRILAGLVRTKRDPAQAFAILRAEKQAAKRRARARRRRGRD